MTINGDIDLNNAVMVLENLADGAKALLRRRGYSDDLNSKETLAFLYPKYGYLEEIRDGRKQKEDQIVRNLYAALLYIDTARASLDKHDYLMAMNYSLSAVRELVSSDLILANAQRNSGRTGGFLGRNPKFSPKILLKMDEDLLIKDPKKYRFANARAQEIAKIIKSSEEAVKKALQRARRKKGTYA